MNDYKDEIERGQLTVKLYQDYTEKECDFTGYEEKTITLNADGKPFVKWEKAGGEKNNYITRAVIFLLPVGASAGMPTNIHTDGESDIEIVWDPTEEVLIT